jgi:lipoyl-dependent peroxiredoxin
MHKEMIMAELHRRASATWSGDLRKGSGTTSTQSGVLKDTSYTFVSRFENGSDTNPEELIAASHASCYSMALANTLSQQGHVPESISTTAQVTLNMGEGGPKVSKIHLTTEGRVPGIDEATFLQAAEETKLACPISRLLLPGLDEMTLDAKLHS